GRGRRRGAPALAARWDAPRLRDRPGGVRHRAPHGLRRRGGGLPHVGDPGAARAGRAARGRGMTAVAAPVERADHAADRRWQPNRVLLVAAGMIVVHLAFRAWAIYGSWYQIDDFNLVSLMYHGDATPVTATETY